MQKNTKREFLNILDQLTAVNQDLRLLREYHPQSLVVLRSLRALNTAKKQLAVLINTAIKGD